MPDTVESFLAEWSAAERTGDTNKLGTLLADDFLGVGPLGFVLPKSAWLARFTGGPVYKTFEPEEIQSRLHGDAEVRPVQVAFLASEAEFDAARDRLQPGYVPRTPTCSALSPARSTASMGARSALRRSRRRLLRADHGPIRSCPLVKPPALA